MSEIPSGAQRYPLWRKRLLQAGALGAAAAVGWGANTVVAHITRPVPCYTTAAYAPANAGDHEAYLAAVLPDQDVETVEAYEYPDQSGNDWVQVYIANGYVAPSTSGGKFTRERPLAVTGSTDTLYLPTSMEAYRLKVTIDTAQRLITSACVPQVGITG
jgi:hypothetical protein